MAHPPGPSAARSPLTRFSQPVQAWFGATFSAPTPAQEGAWGAISQGHHALVVAPTGSGKTLAAFLWAIDRILSASCAAPDSVSGSSPCAPRPSAADSAVPSHPGRILYVSPLKALAADVERNLNAPLTGIGALATQLGTPMPEVTVGIRTGDSTPTQRRRLVTHPPDILITTPESLFLMLTSQAREALRGVSTVIIDEIHAVAGTKRGSHLAVSLERLDALLAAPAQRIGLSATVRPAEAVGRFLAGPGRQVQVISTPSTHRLQIDVVVPVEDLTNLPLVASSDTGTAATADTAGTAGTTGISRTAATPGTSTTTPNPQARASIWPHVEEYVVDLVASHRSTIVFTNSRRSAERLSARMNESWARRTGAPAPDTGALTPALVIGQSGSGAGMVAEFARAHHGSMSRTERELTESALKSGEVRAVVATSSLELGIDMGEVDLVIQIGCPPSVASGLQRVGRAGHQVDATSHGVFIPMGRADLIASVVTAERMRAGLIEEVTPIQNPLDVLAQQIVAMVAMDVWHVADLARVVRGSTPFAALSEGTLHAVLDMLSGHYPSDEFAALRARITWDRTTGLLEPRPGTQRLAVTSGGTIPDRGLYGVFLASDASRGGKRVGELDEEMVYESRVGDTFTLGSSTWRIVEITPDRVLVLPAPGLPGRLPFWKGDSPARPAQLGAAIGAWIRSLPDADDGDSLALATHLTDAGLAPTTARNLLDYLREQRAQTGVVPDDRHLVVERFRDELGDWRIVIHSPYGARVHAPWALVLGARLRERYGLDVQVLAADDGLVLRLPGTHLSGDLAPFPGSGDRRAQEAIRPEDLLLEPDLVSHDVRAELGSSALFSARFREAAARALLLPRIRPDKRAPLWQQRHRGAQLLEIAADFPQFPIMLEAVREALRDDFDLDALTTLMTDISTGRVEVHTVDSPAPSPFARAVLFDYTAQFLYGDDVPLAERRAASLTLDSDLLDELLGSDAAPKISELLDPGSVEALERELSGLSQGYQIRHAEDLVDHLRVQGPWTLDQIRERTVEDSRDLVDAWLGGLEEAHRVLRVEVGRESEIGGTTRWASIEDAGLMRDGLGARLPEAVPGAFTGSVPDPLGVLLARHARTHGPFSAASAARRFGLPEGVLREVLDRLTAARTLIAGSLRPGVLGGTGDEFCDRDVLARLRRMSLASLRKEVEPVAQHVLGSFLPRWQQVGELQGEQGLLRAVEQLAGLPLPASDLESVILPARVRDYSPDMLDRLTTSGQVLWVGHGRLPGRGRARADGLVSLHLTGSAPVTLPLSQKLPNPGGPPGITDAAAPTPSSSSSSQEIGAALLDALADGRALFVNQLCELVASSQEGLSMGDVVTALWDLVWAGRVTNDSFAPVRDHVGFAGHRPASRMDLRTRRAGRPGRLGLHGLAGAGIGGPGLNGSGVGSTALGAAGFAGTLAGSGGRWSLVPVAESDPSVVFPARAGLLLDRYGVVSRAVTRADGLTGQFRGIYQVLSAFERLGQVRRGYFIDELGGSQFADTDAVDLLRELAHGPATDDARVLAACDPTNPYGSILAWPPGTGVPAAHESQEPLDGQPPGAARPTRTPGSVVVLVNGVLVFYVGRGGRRISTHSDHPEALSAAAHALAGHVLAGRCGRLRVEQIDGLGVYGSGTVSVQVLIGAGFRLTPGGLQHPGQPHKM